MGLVEPTPRAIERFAASPDAGGRVVMLNMNRYRAHSAYPGGSEHAACSGREAYARYGEAVFPLIAKHGGRVLYAGAAGIGPIIADGEAWDEIIMVEYPSRQAFFDMTTSAEYLAAAIHRRAGIADSRVVETRPHAYSPS